MGHTRSGTRNTRVQELPRGVHRGHAPYGWGTSSNQGRPWSPTLRAMGEEDAKESTPVFLQRQTSRGHGGNHEPGAIDRVQVITMPGCSVLPADGVTETRNTCTLHARFRVTFHTALHRLI